MRRSPASDPYVLRAAGAREAATRLAIARAGCDAAADADWLEQERATRELIDARAVATEWGVLS
jgi:hypothetical protein